MQLSILCVVVAPFVRGGRRYAPSAGAEVTILLNPTDARAFERAGLVRLKAAHAAALAEHERSVAQRDQPDAPALGEED